MKRLPVGWTDATLKEIAQIFMGQSPASSLINSDKKGLPFFQGKTEFTDIYPLVNKYCEEPSRIAEKDDILLSVRAPVGPVNIAKVRSGFGRGLSAIRSYTGVDYKFLFYQLRSIERHIESLGTGSTFSGINKDKVESLLINIAPQKEQKRIVYKLEELFSELDEGVKELKAAQTKLSQYRQSLLKSAVEGSLTQQWRAENSDKVQETGEQLLARILKQRREQWQQQKLAEFAEKGKTPPKNWQDKYPEPVQPDTTDLPELPEGWVWATIDQLALNKRYGSSSKTNDDSSGVPVLRMGNIQDGKLDYGNLKYLPIDHKEFPELLLQDGDLLFNRTNSAELVGKTAVYRDIGKPVSYASYLISVTFSKYVLPEIVAHYINSVLGKKWIAEVMNQTAGQANVNGTKLGELAIPLPPFDEQVELVQKVINEFESIDQQSEATTLGLKQSEAQRKNILKSAFSGQLVPQDPNDEPASVLLEKIKQEREALAKKPKTKQIKTKSAMKKITVEELTKWVSDYEGNSFTFGELQKTFQGDYDQLKDCVFEILSAKEPILKQVFDQKLNAITFIKEDK
ncbi:TPA: restriction endonuclease subunit S [Vibrio cholerae]|uniref:restriction endonuclease subunit S n=1 Tax=Vibrio cholerae TaxID=666 RepID=UPI00226E43C8|nr:restriction endonuclease subunit S [Vibrio cholerae]MCX9461099.1 restriction endonuclease subunit S [Vibrio cholerae]HDZ9266143.1 restriction endonuclease subunit S [Vibrio cholerae]HDZ9462195.1 restriction endonuclease subunit S [Vibrio cholerae]